MPFTEDHKNKIGAGVRAAWTAERRKKASESRRGANNPFFGKAHTEEQKQRIRKGQLGAKNQFFGKKHTPETIEHLSKSRMGRSSKLYKYGVTDEQYKAETEAGRSWCTFHKGFGIRAYSGVCRGCVSAYNRQQVLKRYDVTAEWYDAASAKQGGGCGICGKQLTDGARLAIDHCHKDGQVRGLLCLHCNGHLGTVEGLNWLKKALEYVEKHKKE